MVEERRVAFHQELEQIDDAVRQLFGLVVEGVAAATQGFLAGDADVARQLREQDKRIDALYLGIEDLVQQQFALQAPVASDLRFLLSVLRIVPELERSADLAEHIASRGAQGLAALITPRARGLIERMGTVAHELWRDAGDAWGDRHGSSALALSERDDELDELHVALTAELASGQLTVPVAMEMALVARFFERLGDHAVHIAARIDYLAGGA
jgi:phosphate transport system protein